MTAVMILSLLLPANEAKILGRVAEEYKLNRNQTILLGVIRRVENGTPGQEMGVEVPAAQRFAGNFEKSLELQGQWAAGTIVKRYTEDIHAFSEMWCPVNATVWESNARYFFGQTQAKMVNQ